MTAVSELLRPWEAAVVAGSDVRFIHRAIDELILVDDLFDLHDGRRVWAGACALIAFYDDASLLSAEARLAIVRELGGRLAGLSGMEMPLLLEERWLAYRRDYVTVDVRPFVKKAIERLQRLEAARRMVVSDPDILGGMPVIRGSRIPVHDVAASVAAGLSHERIRDAYPSLEAGQIDLASLYAQANPQRGRPRIRRDIPEAATVIAQRRVPRRRA